jgi:hypothetical protein
MCLMFANIHLVSLGETFSLNSDPSFLSSHLPLQLPEEGYHRPRLR